jgi:hypothetical protein
MSRRVNDILLTGYVFVGGVAFLATLVLMLTTFRA